MTIHAHAELGIVERLRDNNRVGVWAHEDADREDAANAIKALQATVQEQASEIERLKVEADPDALHIAFLHGQSNANDLRKLIADQHKELTDSQHKVKVLTDALELVAKRFVGWHTAAVEALAAVKELK